MREGLKRKSNAPTASDDGPTTHTRHSWVHASLSTHRRVPVDSWRGGARQHARRQPSSLEGGERSRASMLAAVRPPTPRTSGTKSASR